MSPALRGVTRHDQQASTGRPRRSLRHLVLKCAMLAALVPLSAVAVSCDRDAPGQSSAARRAKAKAAAPAMAAAKPVVPTTAPAVASAPPADEQIASYLYFQYPQGGNPAEGGGDADANQAGTPRQFAPAKLRLTRRDGEVSALLCTDDPKAAINKDWAGDRYYFMVPLPVDELAKVDGTEWWYQTSPGENEETPNGVYLKGDRYHLEPANAIIRFEGQPPHMTVRIAGQFLQYDSADASARPKPVIVRGILLPKVETKE